MNARHLLGCVLSLSLATKYASAIRGQRVIANDGNDLFLVPIMGPTGLATGARVQFSWDYLASSVPSSNLIVALVNGEQLNKYYKITAESEEEFFAIVCAAPSSMRLQLPSNTPSGSYNFTVRYTDQYTLLAVQCSQSYMSSTSLQLQISAESINPDAAGRLAYYLGLEDVPMPNVYLGLLLTCVGLFVIWTVDLVSFNRIHVTGVHVACAVALLMKVLEMGLQLRYYTSLSEDGRAPVSLQTANAVMKKLSLLVNLLVLFVVSLGWKVTRVQLSGREIRLLLVAFGLYLCFSTSEAVCSTQGGDKQLCEAYMLTEYVVYSLILLGIIVSINFNITHLRATLNDYPWSSNVPLSYKNLRSYQFYRWIFLLYLLTPTILLIIRIMLLSWAYNWLYELMREGSILCINVSLAITFGPSAEDLYSQPFAPGGQQTAGQPQQQEPPPQPVVEG